MNDLKQLQIKLQQFAKERDWEKFHSPKNLAMALSGEVGELIEHFQWLTEEESHNLSDKEKSLVEEEMADVFLYLLRLADKTNIDLLDASLRKLELNASKYPIEKSYGTSAKYNNL
ncbi:nucleotide pyrophosphohydrolase [Vibrio parahaemolyticus]|jgi:NTP pyrophosphatase (non-canonical NTP hydrolase)|uniref:nucleotide pyrophosphohydrolase n=1 Tax=Vibrio parahaemolyticus TaxID=670 RepID=UPI00111EA4B5|nr:nucleotide pyrophosphohydrolase [Vibrio parahaemolyticus]TOJ45309.1 nucleotide pyrophosphohydrolase [Vibrio parahaemolyticus]